MAKAKGKVVEQVLVQAAKPGQRRQVAEELKKAEAEGRRFHGFKADLRYTSPEFTVTTPIRYEKLTAKDVEARMKIVHRHVSGVEVSLRPTPYHWAYMDAEGREYPEAEVRHYQLLPDGREVEVQPFPRTKVLEVKKLLPATSLSEFLVEGLYEVWSDAPGQLLEFAEYLQRKDAMAVSKLSFGRGFKESYALIYPIFQDGRFILVMALTQKRVEYRHWMPVEAQEAKPREAVPVAQSVLEEI